MAAGIALLAVTAYRRISPRWLKWLLTATGLLMAGRYLALALLSSLGGPRHFSLLVRFFWLANMVGVTLPGVMALDQLLRHPAMSPKKLLLRFSPFLVIYAIFFLFAPVKAVFDPAAGWIIQLAHPWLWALCATQAAFLAGFIGISLMLMRKIPSTPIRLGLFGLVVGYSYLGLDGILAVFGGSPLHPFLFSEMILLLSFWHAYEISSSLQS